MVYLFQQRVSSQTSSTVNKDCKASSGKKGSHSLRLNSVYSYVEIALKYSHKNVPCIPISLSKL